MTLVHDIALFATRETEDHHFALVEARSNDGETGVPQIVAGPQLDKIIRRACETENIDSISPDLVHNHHLPGSFFLEK